MKSKKSVGRPIEESPIRNAVGLMRHLIGTETGANLRVAAEIEKMAGRPVLTGLPATAARRVSEFILGRKSIPDWVDHAARRWCVQVLAEAMRHREIGILNAPCRLSATAQRELLAEGLVASLLAAVVDEDERRTAAIFRLVNTIRN